MQDMLITCIPERLMLLVEELEVQLQTLDDVELLDCGYSCKQNQGYIVLEWDEEATEAFVAQLNADPDIIDYCVYTGFPPLRICRWAPK